MPGAELHRGRDGGGGRSPQITSKNVPVYGNSVSKIWREDFPVYYLDGAENLPLVGLADWKNLLVYLCATNDTLGDKVYGLTMEVSEDGSRVKLTRETQFPMVADFAEGALTFLDFVRFNTSANSRYMEVSGFPATMNGQPFLLQSTRNRTLYGELTTVNLKDYDIPMAAQDGKYLLPLQKLAAFTVVSNNISVCFNGQALYIAAVRKMSNPELGVIQNMMIAGLLTPELIIRIQTMESTFDEKVEFVLEEISKASEAGKQMVDRFRSSLETNLYLHYTNVPKSMRSEALIRYGINELALELDCFCGLKDTHNIKDFSTFFLQNEVGAGLADSDPVKADQAAAAAWWPLTPARGALPSASPEAGAWPS